MTAAVGGRLIKRIATKRFSCSSIHALPGDSWLERGTTASYNSYHTADYERNLQQIELDFQLPDKPSFYVQNACVTDDSLAPAGHSTLYVLVPVPHTNDNVTLGDAATCGANPASLRLINWHSRAWVVS